MLVIKRQFPYSMTLVYTSVGAVTFTAAFASFMVLRPFSNDSGYTSQGPQIAFNAQPQPSSGQDQTHSSQAQAASTGKQTSHAATPHVSSPASSHATAPIQTTSRDQAGSAQWVQPKSGSPNNTDQASTQPSTTTDPATNTATSAAPTPGDTITDPGSGTPSTPSSPADTTTGGTSSSDPSLLGQVLDPVVSTVTTIL